MPLGLGVGLTSDNPMETGFSSGVLFERNGNWVAGDLTDAELTACTVAVGTTNVGGIRNYVIVTMTDADGNPDPQFAYGSSSFSTLFSPQPQDIFDAGSGSFKLTCKVYVPSTNTSSGTNVAIRVNGTSVNTSVTEDTWTTLSRTKAISACSSPNSDADFFEVEFDNGVPDAPAVGDVFYVTQFKVEFIAD